MSKLTKSWLDKKEPQFDSSMLKVGEMMEVTGNLGYNDQILLRTYDRFISLSNPKAVWGDNLKMIGRKLQPGESITLTQE